jgi:hypothetical protein
LIILQKMHLGERCLPVRKTKFTSPRVKMRSYVGSEDMIDDDKTKKLVKH